MRPSVSKHSTDYQSVLAEFGASTVIEALWAPSRAAERVAAHEARLGEISQLERGPAERARRNEAHAAYLHSRPYEAVTPGVDFPIEELSAVKKGKRGGYLFDFEVCVPVPPWLLAMAGLRPLERTVAIQLWQNLDYVHFKRTGRVRVRGVRLVDLAAQNGYSSWSPFSKAVHRLQDLGVLTIHRVGNTQANEYRFRTVESGRDPYPLGSPQAPRKRLQRLDRKRQRPKDHHLKTLLDRARREGVLQRVRQATSSVTVEGRPGAPIDSVTGSDGRPDNGSARPRRAPGYPPGRR